MNRLNALRSFVQVVESGSFTKAALAQQCHKATISEQIAQLERNLGVRLFTRTTRAVVPTEEGMAYHQKVIAIMTALDEADTTLGNRTQVPSGRLKVEMPVGIGRMVIVPEMRTFLDRYPQIVIDLSCSDRITDLVKEGVDCAVRAGSLPDSNLVARCIGDVPFILCAAPWYLERRGRPMHPHELERHELVGYRNLTTHEVSPLKLTRDSETVELHVPMRMVTTDSATVLQAGLAGIGIVHVSAYVAAHYLDSGELIRVLPDWQGRGIPLSLISPTTRHRAARVQVFMDWAHELLVRYLS